MSKFAREQIAAMIDHALLRPEATLDDLRGACELAAEARVASLCVRPCDVCEARALLDGSGVAVGTVVGFPFGYETTSVKAAQARRAIDDGAEELDMVLNVSRLRSGEVDFVRDDISSVVRAAGGRCVKVILECCYLDRSQKLFACRAAREAGAGFVKTSTGLGPSGATVEDVRLLREAVGESLGVKAAGGIRSLGDAVAMIRAGASRIGTSSTREILAELP